MLRAGDADGGGAVDAGRDRAARAAGRGRRRPTRSGSFAHRRPARCRSSGSARCCRAAARGDEPAGAHAAGGGDPQRAAAHRAARRRSARQPGSGGQEPRPAAVAPARPGRRDAAGLGRAGADLQPGGAGHAVRRAARGAGRAPRPRRTRRRPRAAAAAGRAPLRAAGAGGRRFADRAPRHAAPAGARGLPRDARPRTASTRSNSSPRRRPAVVLSDIEMPRMDGFDLARNMRADAALADLPIIMITSRIAAEAPRPRERARRRPLPRQAVLGRRAAGAGGPLRRRGSAGGALAGLSQRGRVVRRASRPRACRRAGSVSADRVRTSEAHASASLSFNEATRSRISSRHPGLCPGLTEVPARNRHAEAFCVTSEASCPT